MKITASVFSCLQGKVRSLFSLCLMLLVLLPLTAQADRAQARRLYLNANGDLTLTGNMLVHCSTSDSNCNNARNGVGDLDNYFTFTTNGDFAYVDADGVTGTSNSSSATLNMPAGSTVRWAGLYWGSRYSTAASAAVPAPTSSTAQLKFRTPAMAGYQTITPTTLDYNAGNASNGSSIQAFADVTSLVAAAGNGTYWGADISVPLARNAWAGWALIVVYENPALPFRNFAVYDGFGFISNATVTLTPSGFLTPLSGPVVSRLGVVLWDGDRTGNTGESLLLNNTSLTNAANPSGDVWNSTISDLGANIASRNPNYLNTLGVDIDRFNVPVGTIPNGATSATIGIRSPSTDEVFLFGIATFMTDIYVPVVVPNVLKTSEDMSPATPLLRGDTLRWHVSMSNSGLDAATNLVVIDNIPPNLTYKPGSLVINSGANAGSKSDTSGNDQAEFLTGPDRVVFRLGTGANASQGGTLAYDESTSFYFDTIVNADTPAGTTISNQVQIQYSSQTIPASTFAASSAAASATVLGPPTISKSFSPVVIDVGQNSLMTIVLANPSGNPLTLTGVSFSDSYPVNMVNAANPNPQVSCTPGSSAGTITGAVAGGNSIGMSPGATIAANGSCSVTVNVTSAQAGSYTNTTAAVSSSNGGTGLTASATLTVGKPGISKAFAPASIAASGTAVSTISFVITNPTSLALTGVSFSDTLTNMQVASTPNVVGNCGGGVVTALASSNSIALAGGALTALGTCTIKVDVTSTTRGVHANITSGVSSAQTGTPGAASNTAYLTVIGPPVLSKSFFPLSVRTNSPSTMTLVLSNPNTTATITGAAFTDNYPTTPAANAMVNSTPANASLSCTAGSSATMGTITDGGTSASLSNGVLAPGGSCTLTVDVQSSAVGDKPNSIATVSSSNAGNGPGASATLVVNERLGIGKAFSPSTINVNTQATSNTSTLTITVSRSGTGTINGINFEDQLPAGMVIASATTAGSCSATGRQGRTGVGAWGAVAAGNTAFRWTGGVLSSASCTITLTVAGTQSGALVNTIDTAYSSDGGTAGPATATLTVVEPPEVSKSFEPDSISTCSSAANDGCAAGAYSTLKLTVSNPSTVAMTVSLVDNFDLAPNSLASLFISSTTSTRTCSSPTSSPATSTFQSSSASATWSDGMTVGRTRVRINALSLQAGQTCEFTVRVRSNNAGNMTNSTENVSYSDAGGSGGPGGSGTAAKAAATLSVGQIDVAKSLCTTSATNAIAANADCTMTLQFSNSSGNTRAITLIDNFPGQTAAGGSFTLANATLTRTVGGGTCTLAFAGGYTGSSNAGNWSSAAATGNTGIRLQGNVPTGGCTYTLTVRATETLTNTIAAGGLTATGGYSNGAATSATIYIAEPLTVQKSFAVASVPVSTSTSMSIALSNLNGFAASSVTFTDVFPGEASTASASPFRLASAVVGNNCGGTVEGRSGSSGSWVTPAAGHTALRLTGGNIAIGSVCAVTADVISPTAGSYTNSTGQVNTGNVGNTAADTATLVVMAPPTVAKAFTPNSIIVNETSLLTITLNNPNSLPATGVALTDSYPSGLVNTATPNASTSCLGGTLTAAAGGNNVALTGASIPANGSCTINIQVTSATAAASGYTNNTGSVTTTNAGTGASASAVLTVTPYLPSLSLTKLVSVISDPVNNITNPKYIPGAVASYSVRMTNAGQGSVDNNTLYIRDPLPAAVELYVGGTNTDPPTTTLQGFVFSASTTPASGLSCTFGARNNGGDCIDFSSDGTTFGYTPAPNADGYDPNIKAIQFRPSGIFNPSGGGNPWAEFQFRVRVK